MGPKHTPSDLTFWLSLALVVLAILSMFAKIPYVSTYPLWIAVIGYAIFGHRLHCQDDLKSATFGGSSA
jgi:hypothetical protein